MTTAIRDRISRPCAAFYAIRGSKAGSKVQQSLGQPGHWELFGRGGCSPQRGQTQANDPEETVRISGTPSAVQCLLPLKAVTPSPEDNQNLW